MTLTRRDDLGNALVNFARVVPDGLLVFFPSYGVLTSCVEAWKVPPPKGGAAIWDRICNYKSPVVEPRDSALFPAAAEDFRAKLDDPVRRGAVFFAVCRGKASEGIDFSDRAGRAVIVTGIPYAMKNDPKVRLKQNVLDEAARAAPTKRARDGAAVGGSSSAGGIGDGGLPRGLTGDQWYVQQAVRAVNQAMGRAIRHRHDYGAVLLCDERFKGEASVCPM
jgi:regulator of telomere elongation helicase 1